MVHTGVSVRQRFFLLFFFFFFLGCGWGGRGGEYFNSSEYTLSSELKLKLTSEEVDCWKFQNFKNETSLTRTIKVLNKILLKKKKKVLKKLATQQKINARMSKHQILFYSSFYFRRELSCWHTCEHPWHIDLYFFFW